MAYELFYEYLFPMLEGTELSFVRLFQYITFRAAYAAITAMLISLILTPYFIRYLKKKKVPTATLR